MENFACVISLSALRPEPAQKFDLSPRPGVLLFDSFETLKIAECLEDHLIKENIEKKDILGLLELHQNTTLPAYAKSLRLSYVKTNEGELAFRSDRSLSLHEDQLRTNPLMKKVFDRQQAIVPTPIKFDPYRPSGLTSAVVVKREQSHDFGVQICSLNGGIYISYVREDSPAARAGLRFTDQITHIDGKPVTGVKVAEVMGMLTNKDTWKITKKDR
ncbi:unnamed protein product [Dibothriocephalus latus]|uniref:PDZ domain-containing protein n=1 Tax=Dibothriocephalus latus TaxID=60516 RepID=A0A3P7QW46_DIBLA|nr:unnamed protein product [Dibothriocephalus latus]